MASASDITYAFSGLGDLYVIEGTACPYCNDSVMATKDHLKKVHIKYAICFSDEKVVTILH